MAKFVVKNVTKRPLTISDITTYGIEILPGKTFDLAKAASLSQIGKSQNLQDALKAKFIIVYDQKSRKIERQDLAEGYLGRSIVDEALEGGSGSGSAAVTITATKPVTLTGSDVSLDYSITDFQLSGATTLEIQDSGIDHDSLTNYVANEHIDWTNTTANIVTTGSITAGSINNTKSVNMAIATKIGAYTLTDSNFTILADATTASFNLSLPSVAGIAGRLYALKKIDSSDNIVHVVPNGAELIDSATHYDLELQDEFVYIISDGTRWNVIAE